MSSIKFGTDGWRAAIAAEFTFDAVQRLAIAVARYIQHDDNRSKEIVVSYDRRFASERFAAVAAATMAECGLVIHLTDRAIPTQVGSFSAHRMGCMAFVVTASHNEWLDNGVKIKDTTGAPAEEDVLRHIESHVPATLDASHIGAEQGRVETQDLTAAYIDKVRTLVDLDAIAALPNDLLVDPIHGCGAGWLDLLLPEARTLTINEIRSERNPFFGGVNPEPILPHVSRLVEAVVESGAGGGFAFDGDADRLGLVTESGQFVNQLQVYGLLYWHLLADRGLIQPAVYTLTSTQMVPRLASAFGTKAFETPVGFKYVGPKMAEVGAVIGGEESGGFGFGFHIPERDGLVAALLLLEMKAHRSASFDELLSDLQQQYGPSHYSRIDVRFERAGYGELMDRVMREVDDRITSLSPDGVQRVDRLGSSGIKTFFVDGSWLLLRFSGTEPVLRIYAEAPTERRVRELLERGHALVA